MKAGDAAEFFMRTKFVGTTLSWNQTSFSSCFEPCESAKQCLKPQSSRACLQSLLSGERRVRLERRTASQVRNEIRSTLLARVYLDMARGCNIAPASNVTASTVPFVGPQEKVRSTRNSKFSLILYTTLQMISCTE